MTDTPKPQISFDKTNSETISKYRYLNDGSDADGKYSTDGLAALKKLDSNNDGKFNNQDAKWNDLRIWADGNSDAQTDAGELKTLDEAGIKEFDLTSIIQANKERNEGNVILAKSTYTTTDNQIKQVAAVDFTTNPIGYEFRNFLRKVFIPIILATTLILTACNTTELNQISIKKIKNETTGEVEEYRSIKISEDDQNDYFLEVKIPKTHRQISWNRLSKDNALMNEFIPKNSSEREYVSNFRISEELYPKKSLYDYMMWRKGYIEGYKTYRGLVDYDLPQQANINLPNAFPESGTITHEMMCLPKLGIICLPNQKEMNIIKAYKGKTTFWTIEFSKVIDGRLSELEKENVVSESELMMKDCCKILTIKKLVNNEPKEDSLDNKKKMGGK